MCLYADAFWGYGQAPGTPTLYVVVAALPKGALVEKQVVVHTGRCYIKDEDGEVETHVQDPSRGEGEASLKRVTAIRSR